MRQFQAQPVARDFPVLASTGAAAVLIGGRTFHSFFGLGILEGGPAATVERAARNRQVVKRIKAARGVVIDEISMLSGPVLRVAEVIARRIRGSDLPWGGLRIIAVGDFAQLPPVERDVSRGGGWAFLDPVWELSGFIVHQLATQVRCKDEDYMRLLSQIRIGAIDRAVVEYLDEKMASRRVNFEGTRLFARRDQTDRFNEERLAELDGKPVTIETVTSGQARGVETLYRQAPIPPALRLKEGALIMIRQNDPMGRWVNGSTGRLLKIQTGKLKIELISGGRPGRLVELEKATFTALDGDGFPIASATNFPISLAWATTIHKAQGATLEQMEVDLSNLWEPGHAYVALSRLTSGDGLQLSAWRRESIKVDSSVVEFYRSHSERNRELGLPVLQW